MSKSISQNKSSRLIMRKYLNRAMVAYKAGDNKTGYALLWQSAAYAPNAYTARIHNLLLALPVE